MKSFKEIFREITEEIKQTKRIGIQHLNKLKPMDFIKLVNLFKNEMDGKITNKNASITLKIDGFGCVGKDTIIETKEQGKIKISDVPNFNELHVKSFNIKTNKIEFNKILNYQEIPSNNDWYEIETISGKKLKITGEHKIYIPYQNIWKRIDKLKENEKVLINE